MRKWASLFLALAAAFSLAACGSAGDQENTGQPPVSSGGSAPVETPVPSESEAPAV